MIRLFLGRAQRGQKNFFIVLLEIGSQDTFIKPIKENTFIESKMGIREHRGICHIEYFLWAP